MEHSNNLLHYRNDNKTMTACHQAFLNYYPYLTEKYEDFNVWLFSQELICVAFRQGWASCNDYRNQ